MESAAAEAGDFAGGVQPGDRASAVVEDARGQVGVQPAERFAGEDVEPDGDQWSGPGVEQLAWGGGAKQAPPTTITSASVIARHPLLHRPK